MTLWLNRIRRGGTVWLLALAVSAPARGAEPDSVAAASAPRGERWTLARCVATALEHNADVRAAQGRTRQASGSALEAWGGLLPSISIEGSYGIRIPDKTTAFTGVDLDSTGYPGLGIPADTTISTFGLATRQDALSLTGLVQTNLLSFPAISRKRAQDHFRRTAEEDEQEVRNQVVFRTKTEYFELHKAGRLADVARDSEKLARDEEARAEALFQVGTVARGDVLKARARRAETQLERIRAVNQVEIQRSRLRQALGVDKGTPIEIEPDFVETVAIPDSAESVNRALEARPRVRGLKAAERGARSSLFAARMQRAPAVTGALSVDRTRFGERVEDIVGFSGLEVEPERWATEWQGQVRVSVPLFDGLAIEGNVRRAKGSLLEAEASRRQFELDVVTEVQQAWLTLRMAKERIEVAREGLASAEEDYKFSKGRYDLGAGTYLDLLTAELGLERARQTHVEAQADLRIAEAALEFAIGDRRY